MALDQALDAIATPALVLARDGRIERANRAAHVNLDADAPAVYRALERALGGGPKRRAGVDRPTAVWDLTPSVIDVSPPAFWPFCERRSRMERSPRCSPPRAGAGS